MSRNDDIGILAFFELASALKEVRRQGWLDRGVEDPESVADHSWAVALLAWSLASERDDLDRERVLLLGLVHDLPEALAGDTTPFDDNRDATGRIESDLFRQAPGYSEATRAHKREVESAALAEILSPLPPSLAAEIREAWQEYEESQTPEARFVKQVDKLETVIQAERYRSQDPDLVMESFRLGAQRDIVDSQLRQVLAALLDDTQGTR